MGIKGKFPSGSPPLFSWSWTERTYCSFLCGICNLRLFVFRVFCLFLVMEEYNKPRPKMSPRWAKIEKALFPKYGIYHFLGYVAAQAEILVNGARIAALKTAVSTRQVIPGTDDYEAASKEQCLLEMRNEFLRSRSGAASTPGTASSSRTTSSRDCLLWWGCFCQWWCFR